MSPSKPPNITSVYILFCPRPDVAVSKQNQRLTQLYNIIPTSLGWPAGFVNVITREERLKGAPSKRLGSSSTGSGSTAGMGCGVGWSKGCFLATHMKMYLRNLHTQLLCVHGHNGWTHWPLGSAYLASERRGHFAIVHFSTLGSCYHLINKTPKEIKIVKDIKWARLSPTGQETEFQVGTSWILEFLLNKRSPAMIIKEAGN